MAASNFIPSDECKTKKEFDDLFAACKAKLDKLKNLVKLEQADLAGSISLLDQLVTVIEENPNDPKNVLSDDNIELMPRNSTPYKKLKKLNKYINNVIEKFHHEVEKVLDIDPAYNQSINRICFRGDKRPPYDKDKKGIFEEQGFSKKNLDPKYQASVQAFLESFDQHVRVNEAFNSNIAKTNCFSRDIHAAAFFPVSLSGIVDKIWIYVVLIEKGFNVHGHGFITTSKQNLASKEYRLFFSQEICSDEVLPDRVIAAYHVKRIWQEHRIKERNNHFFAFNNATIFSGKGKFEILDLVFNESALKHIQKTYSVDIEKYKELLQKFKDENKKKYGHDILLSKDGYKKQSDEDKAWISTCSKP